MASWNDLLAKVEGIDAISPVEMIRREALRDLAQYRGRNIICYYSGWLQRAESVKVSITDDDMNGLMNAMCGLDRSKGLDLVLHTPGGDLAATEAIVSYIRDCFDNDVCAIVPQMAMSAGTMIACACKEVIMGRQSSLGPTDPQFGGVAAGGVVEEFEQAVREVQDNPASVPLWGQIIGKYHPTFLGDCKKAVDVSREIVGKWLGQNMLKDDTDAEQKLPKILDKLCDHSQSAMHNRHFSHVDLEEMGFKVMLMEDDDDLQDRVLTLHHAFMITFQQSNIIKIIEGSNEKSWIVSGGTP